MRPTIEETLGSVMGLLEHNVAPAVQDEFAAAMLRMCISALERLQRRVPTEFTAMTTECQEIDGLLAGANPDPARQQRAALPAAGADPLELLNEGRIQQLYVSYRGELADRINALASQADSVAEAELARIGVHLRHRAETAGLGFNLTP